MFFKSALKGKYYMKINLVTYDENNTDPLSNVLRECFFYNNIDFIKKYHERVKDLKNKEYFKNKFGKQYTTKNYSHRNWIWTFTSNDELATIHALVSTRGILWEYNTSITRKNNLLRLVREIEQELIS